MVKRKVVRPQCLRCGLSRYCVLLRRVCVDVSDLFYTQGRKYILTEKGKKLLIKEYDSLKSINQISQIFGVYRETIGKWLTELGIEHRQRKYSINEHYFDVIDEPEKAYWLGFLAADGYVHDERGELNLQLQERDKGHLEKFAKALECEIPIMTIHSSYAGKPLTHYRFSVKCRKMVDALKQWGIVQNKSFILTPPTGIDKNLMSYWILGYLDGDGCVENAKKRIRISFTGTLAVLEYIKDFFHSNNTIRLEHRCNNTYHFALEVAKSEDFLAEMEYDKIPFVLERKAQRFALFRENA